MVALWAKRIELGISTLEDVPERYYNQVIALLVKKGLYDEGGNEVK